MLLCFHHDSLILEPGINLSNMAECESMTMAEHIVDAILLGAAKHRYEKYLQPKIMPYATLTASAE